MALISGAQPGNYGTSLPTDVYYGRCTLKVVYGTFDTPDDPDAFPEVRVPAAATLTVSPNFSGMGKATDSTLISFSSQTFTSSDGTFDFYCIDGSSPGVNPTGWNWTAVLNTEMGSTTIVFQPEKDTTLNLGSLAPLQTAAGVATVQGPAGPSPTVVWDGDQLVVNGVTGPHLTGPAGSGTGTTDYNDLINKPVLAPVATSGVYSDLTGKPSLFSGSYTDLTNKPTLGTAAAQNITAFATAAQGAKADTAVQPSGSITGNAATATKLATARTIAGKSFDGTANITIGATDVGAATTAQGTKADSAVQPGSLATVATTGSYNDLLNKPAASSGGFIPGSIIPPIGQFIGGYGVVSILQNANTYYLSAGTALSSTTPIRIICPTSMTVDAVTIRIDTAQAGASAKVLIYSIGSDGSTLTLISTSSAIDCSAITFAVSVLPVPLPMTVGEYAAVIITDQSVGGALRFRGVVQTSYVQIGTSTGLTATGNTFDINPGTYSSPSPTPSISWGGWNRDTRAMVGLRRSA